LRFHSAMRRDRVRVLATANFDTFRGVGRKQLPTSIGGAAGSRGRPHPAACGPGGDYGQDAQGVAGLTVAAAVRITRAHFDILGSSQAEAVKVENEALDFRVERNCSILPAEEDLACLVAAHLSGRRRLPVRTEAISFRDDCGKMPSSNPFHIEPGTSDFRQQTVT